MEIRELSVAEQQDNLDLRKEDRTIRGAAQPVKRFGRRRRNKQSNIHRTGRFRGANGLKK